MAEILVTWLLSALALLLIAWVIPGIDVDNFMTALLAALVFGVVNATLGFILKILTFPLTLVTIGLFLFVVNALMLKLAAAIVPGFRIRGCVPALLGAVLLAVVTGLLRFVVMRAAF
jgi:putative membrane protein